MMLNYCYSFFICILQVFVYNAIFLTNGTVVLSGNNEDLSAVGFQNGKSYDHELGA